MVVRMARHADGPGLRPGLRERVGVRGRRVRRAEVARRADARREADAQKIRLLVLRVLGERALRRRRRVPGEPLVDEVRGEKPDQRVVRVEGLRPPVPAVVGEGAVSRARPRLPRVQEIGMRPVGAAVEDADGRTFAGEALVPGIGELVRLRIEDAELLQAVEVAALRRRSGRVRNLLAASGPFINDFIAEVDGVWLTFGSGIPSGEAVCFSWTSFTETTPGSPASFVASATRTEPTTNEMSPAPAYMTAAHERGGIRRSVALRPSHRRRRASSSPVATRFCNFLVELRARGVRLGLHRLRLGSFLPPAPGAAAATTRTNDKRTAASAARPRD